MKRELTKYNKNYRLFGEDDFTLFGKIFIMCSYAVISFCIGILIILELTK